MIVTRGDVAINVVAEGDGEPVVLLHGHTLDLRVWDHVSRPLVTAGFRVVRYDQRGSGRSTSPPAEYRFGDHAGDLAAVIRACDAAPAQVVGLSKGCGIALELALRQPSLVRSLTLVGPLVPDVRLSDGLIDSFRALARAIRSGGPTAVLGEVWMSHPLLATAAAQPEARQRLETMLGSYPAGEYLASHRDEPDRDWTIPDRLKEIAVPTLVVRGSEEVPDFRSMAELIASRVPGAALEVIGGSGHLVPLEQPAALSALLLDFLRAGRPAAPAAAPGCE